MHNKYIIHLNISNFCGNIKDIYTTIFNRNYWYILYLWPVGNIVYFS